MKSDLPVTPLIFNSTVFIIAHFLKKSIVFSKKAFFTVTFFKITVRFWWRLGDSNPRSVTLQISFGYCSFIYAHPVDRLPPSNTYNHHNIFTNHLFYLTQKLYQIHDFYSHVQERCKGYISRVCFDAREHQKENKKQINMRFCLIKTAYVWRRV